MVENERGWATLTRIRDGHVKTVHLGLCMITITLRQFSTLDNEIIMLTDSEDSFGNVSKSTHTFNVNVKMCLVT